MCVRKGKADAVWGRRARDGEGEKRDVCWGWGVLPAGRDVLHHMLDRKLERRSVTPVRTRVEKLVVGRMYIYVQYKNTRI